MATLSGLQSGFFTDIDVVDSIAINGDVGTANQVLTSDGTKTSYQDPTLPAVSSLLNAGTGITISSTGNPETIATNVKSLVLDGTAVSSAPQTFNPNADGGSQTITINDTDTQLTLTEGSGIDITDLGGTNRRIAANIDADTIVFSSNEITCAKVPNVLTAGTNISFADTSYGAAATTYDGSSGITISSTYTNTQLNLTEGNGITITNTGGVNRTIALNADGTTLSNNVGSGQAGVLKVPNTLTAGSGVSFTDTSDGASATTYDGSSGITIKSSPYFFHNAYDPSSLDSDSLSTSYANIFSSNLFSSFTAEETSCAIELRVYNAQTSSFGRSTFARLNGSSSTSSTAEFTTFYSTGGRDTTRTLHQADESDDVYLTMTWVLTGLTIGNSYNLYPQMRSTSSSGNFIRAGGSNAPAILRGYYLPATGG